MDAIERWVRKDASLELVQSFPSRASWWTKGLLLTDTRDGVVTARDARGEVRWTWQRETSGAAYGVLTRDGLLLHDDAHAHWLDLTGQVRRTLHVESADVSVARDGTVYLKTLTDLWIFEDQDARAVVIGVDAELETTCSDGAVLRDPDGKCLLVGKHGGSAAFLARDARFPLLGTRGGPWLVEGDRIRGVFELNAHTLAETFAVALGGATRELPSHSEGRAFAVVLPDGRAPVLVRRFVPGSLGAIVYGTRSWRLAATQSPAAVAAISVEVAGAVRDWLASSSPAAPTLTEMALAALARLSSAFDERWTAAIPGTDDPSEMWLQGRNPDAARVGVFAGRFVIPSREVIPIRHRGDLDLRAADLVAAVRAQHEAYRLRVSLSASVRSLADALASRLGAHLSRRCVASGRGGTSYESALSAHIVFEDDPRRTLATIEAHDGAVRVHAGVPGVGGWDGHGTDADAMLEGVAAAVARAESTLTLDRLVPGSRYRVIGKLRGFARGEVVRFEGFDDIDNHYGEYIFVTDGGRSVTIGGDYSTPERSPLAEVYRVLEEA